MAKRRCKGKTKAEKRCRAAPLRDRAYCSAHDPESPGSTRFGSPEQAAAAGALGGRPPRPRAVDVLRERVEADVDAVLAPLFEGLAADRGVVVGAGESAQIEMVVDWSTRLAAARELLDRGYGKPRQTIEHAGPEDGSAIPVEFTLSKTARKAIGDALRTRPAARAGE